ncbi:DNA cytosine methyltransferase [Pseudoxanthomonas helianthi]|uniref:DNA (cytosine-5-)-methyltransferase n=1 Tax=Pseudoxanthomonas helianthi TaxID=1453541 RepID=A0A941AUU1_9GAMM|nr:DNA (cytosine-5-)-methyltransferase [Pseudoxanthomonas helianthi]MBP3983598.1 DNA cytosine methyltransferase [Pseudoxanthomonas helianthi]
MRGLDIFCGGGGSSAGARAAGVEMVGAVDMCPVATDTYRANFKDTHVVTGRLEHIVLPALRKQVGSIDILLASPECTNHTCAKGAAPRSEESRATALYAVQYARAFRPRWIVLENVVHMRPWSRYGELKHELQNLGYHIAEQVLDASDYGVAQSRKRLFLVGDLKGQPGVVDRKRSGPRKGAKSILDKLGTWDTTPLFTDKRAKGTLARAHRAMAALGPDKPFLMVYYGSDGSGGWQPLERPLRTITTVDRFALVEPSLDGHRMRMLQVPELQRAMGFDDTYQLEVGTRRDRVRILGNGVCPPVMTEVVAALTRNMA